MDSPGERRVPFLRATGRVRKITNNQVRISLQFYCDKNATLLITLMIPNKIKFLHIYVDAIDKI